MVRSIVPWLLACAGLAACAAAPDVEGKSPTAGAAPGGAADVVVLPAGPAASHEPRPAHPARPQPTVEPRPLPRVCEEYLATMERCFTRALDGVPPSEREKAAISMAKASATTREAWAQIDDVSALETACTAANDALAANASCAP